MNKQKYFRNKEEISKLRAKIENAILCVDKRRTENDLLGREIWLKLKLMAFGLKCRSINVY